MLLENSVIWPEVGKIYERFFGENKEFRASILILSKPGPSAAAPPIS